MPNLKKQLGLSLIEVIVGIVISIILLEAANSIFSTVFWSSTKLTTNGGSYQALYTAMDLMASDVKRAGYWSNANTSSRGISDFNITPTCITFRYDLNRDNTIQDTERFGYRYNPSGFIEYRNGTIYTGCDTPFSGHGWPALTHRDQVIVTNFSVNAQTIPVRIVPGGNGVIQYRLITLTLAGRPANSDKIISIQRTIKVENPAYAPPST